MTNNKEHNSNKINKGTGQRKTGAKTQTQTNSQTKTKTKTKT